MLNKTQKKTSPEKYKITINNVKNLPQTTGVYVFRGRSDFPLYIGKSVNIRSRVMSHLRNPNEKKMISQVLQIDFIETAGEIGALLLESQMIKEYSPLFNMRLRRLRYLCTISTKKTANGISPKILDSNSVSFGFTPDLYGLFPSRHAANAKLRKLAQDNKLCQAILNLESVSHRGCFGLQIKTCLGVCIGKEDRETHDSRLLEALEKFRVEVWPFHGPIDLVEQFGDWIQRHRVINWCHLGTWCSKTKNTLKYKPTKDFDLDSYKILVKPIILKKKKIEIVDL